MGDDDDDDIDDHCVQDMSAARGYFREMLKIVFPGMARADDVG